MKYIGSVRHGDRISWADLRSPRLDLGIAVDMQEVNGGDVIDIHLTSGPNSEPVMLGRFDDIDVQAMREYEREHGPLGDAILKLIYGV